MTREEILNLDKLSEEEQIRWLAEHDILQTTIMQCLISRAHQWGHYESLAECAFRLRGEADEYYQKHIAPKGLMHPLYIAMNDLWGEKAFDETYGCAPYWLYQAKPVHFIQAALLAKGEGKE
jgi:hypothetical protein